MYVTDNYRQNCPPSVCRQNQKIAFDGRWKNTHFHFVMDRIVELLSTIQADLQYGTLAIECGLTDLTLTILAIHACVKQRCEVHSTFTSLERRFSFAVYDTDHVRSFSVCCVSEDDNRIEFAFTQVGGNYHPLVLDPDVLLETQSGNAFSIYNVFGMTGLRNSVNAILDDFLTPVVRRKQTGMRV